MTADTVHDPKRSASYRVLLAVVIILGVLILLALAALVFGAVMTFGGRHGGGCLGRCGIAELPQGAKIISTQVAGSRVIIVFHDLQGDGVEIVDADTGKHIALIAPAAHGLPR